MNIHVEKYHRELLGDEYDLFLDWIKKPIKKSIRINPIRTSVSDFSDELKKMSAEQIPWCSEGFFVGDGAWGATISHQFGYYYIQEAASMLPPIALDVQRNDIVLDLAAAPGSKTTQIAPYCNTVVANDPNYQRRRALVSNIERCGIMNCAVTHYDGMRFPQKMEFDRVLIDAPCSNIGSARKSPRVLKTWSPGFAKRISGLQKGLIRSAFRLLKPGGTMIYSTCTSSTEENEGVVLDLLEKNADAKIEDININVKSRPGILEGTKKTMRIYPWDNDTEFFYLAKISKNG